MASITAVRLILNQCATQLTESEEYLYALSSLDEGPCMWKEILSERQVQDILKFASSPDHMIFLAAEEFVRTQMSISDFDPDGYKLLSGALSREPTIPEAMDFYMFIKHQTAEH